MEGKGTLTMPAGHTEGDVEVARELARLLELGELHVFWSGTPRRAPAAQPFPLPGISRALSGFGALGALGEALGWLSGRLDTRQRR